MLFYEKISIIKIALEKNQRGDFVMNMTERLSVLAKHPLLNSIVSALIGAAATIIAVFISNNVRINSKLPNWGRVCG